MRHRSVVAVLAVAISAALPVAGQQLPPPGGAALSLVLPPYPADTARPPIQDPQFAPNGERERNCKPAWTCRIQLFGAVQKNGAVGLKGTAFTW